MNNKSIIHNRTVDTDNRTQSVEADNQSPFVAPVIGSECDTVASSGGGFIPPVASVSGFGGGILGTGISLLSMLFVSILTLHTIIT